MTILYNKAVRDRIPEIIRKTGKECQITSLSDDDFLPELEKKLQEELDEYMESKSLEELADIIEIIHRLVELNNSSMTKLELIRQDKKKERGGFEANLFLLNVT
jgi:predicted house-cleaning noncanonical NTP pyrophosphatase (MazG superfamily)